MQSQLVFQEKTEIERLRVQNDLLSCYEVPVLAQIFSEGTNLSVLDIGCNDGSKTAERFSSEAVSHVIGLEYNAQLAQEAQTQYGSKKFSFYHMDVEAEDFSQQLDALLRQTPTKRFDLIYLSFVLMHLTDVNRLLVSLRRFLKPDGRLFIIEPDDAASTLNNDPDGLLCTFLQMLAKDRYSGHREVGARLCGTLSACGYEKPVVWYDAIAAGPGEREKKQAIFTTFFSYLSEDVRLLREADPENEEYCSWAVWLDHKEKTLRDQILKEDAVISMGMKILTCAKGGE